MDGLHNYPLKELATDALTSSAGNMSELVRVARQMQVQCTVCDFTSIHRTQCLIFLGRYPIRILHGES
jgi:hypothetical protein